MPINLVQDGTPRPLLPAIASKYLGRKCLVLDLDETLVHSSLKVRATHLGPGRMYTHDHDATARTGPRLHRPR